MASDESYKDGEEKGKITDDICNICKEEIISESKMIECESCKEWACNRCHGFSKTVLKFLKEPGVHWICKECDIDFQIKKKTEHNNREEVFENLKQEITTLQNENKNIRLKLNETKLKMQEGKDENDELKAQLVKLTTKKRPPENEQKEDKPQIEKMIEQMKNEIQVKDKEIKNLQNKLKKNAEEIKKIHRKH